MGLHEHLDCSQRNAFLQEVAKDAISKQYTHAFLHVYNDLEEKYSLQISATKNHERALLVLSCEADFGGKRSGEIRFCTELGVQNSHISIHGSLSSDRC